MTDHKALRLVDVLRDQRQCDEDGVMCIVSRQAVDEAVQIIESLTAAPSDHKAEWVLVPREPTQEWRDTVANLLHIGDAEMDSIHAALLAAAPAAGEGEDGAELRREVLHWLDSLPNAVRVHPGGGAESLAQSFAVNAAVHTRPAAQVAADTPCDMGALCIGCSPRPDPKACPAAPAVAKDGWADSLVDELIAAVRARDPSTISLARTALLVAIETTPADEGAQVAATTKHDACETCDGQGVVGGFVGQTAEQYVEVYENCPDCTPKHDDAQNDALAWMRAQAKALGMVAAEDADAFYLARFIAPHIKFPTPKHDEGVKALWRGWRHEFDGGETECFDEPDPGCKKCYPVVLISASAFDALAAQPTPKHDEGREAGAWPDDKLRGKLTCLASLLQQLNAQTAAAAVVEAIAAIDAALATQPAAKHDEGREALKTLGGMLRACAKVDAKEAQGASDALYELAVASGANKQTAAGFAHTVNNGVIALRESVDSLAEKLDALATQPAARRVTEDPWVSELIAAAQGLADEQVYSDHDEPDYEPEDGKHNGPPAKARNKHQRAYWRLRAALESFAQPAEGVSGG